LRPEIRAAGGVSAKLPRPEPEGGAGGPFDLPATGRVAGVHPEFFATLSNLACAASLVNDPPVGATWCSLDRSLTPGVFTSHRWLSHGKGRQPRMNDSQQKQLIGAVTTLAVVIVSIIVENSGKK
jgi:hypothetical protein